MHWTLQASINILLKTSCYKLLRTQNHF